MSNANTTLTLTLGAGGGLALWYLLREKQRNRPAAATNVPTATTNAPASPAPCRVWVRANRIELDGAPADLATVVTRCRQVGHADVRATGDAITRSITDVLGALNAAGVRVNAAPEISRLVRTTGTTR